MKSLPVPARRRTQGGSVLGATLVVALAITVVLTGLIGWVNTESRVARGHLLQTKAEYAAEATAEYAVAQIRCVLQQKAIFSSDLFTGTGAITVPNHDILGGAASSVLPAVTGSGASGYATNIAASLASLQAGASSADGRYAITGTSINVGSFTSEATVTLDPNDVLYQNDPLRGQKVRMRRVRILAAATAADSARNESHTAYCEEILQVRDTALFNFISFYNMDLEVAPLPHMSVVGAIHTNRDFYVGSINGVDFYDVVTAAGDVRHGYPAGLTSMGDLTGDVTFKGPIGNQVSMKTGSTWIDSSHPTWKTTALSRWGGNLLNKSHGITATTPASVPPYAPDNPSTPAYDPVNEAHNLIEPSIKVSAADYPGEETEMAKFANQACLVLTVNRVVVDLGALSTAITTPKLYKYVPDAAGDYVRPTSTGAARYKRVELNLPSGMVTTRKFYDRRQDEYVFGLDIDVSVLKSAIEVSGVNPAFTNGSNTFNPDTEWNGIVYVEDKNPALTANTIGAVRLVNGRHLPNKPTAANSHASGFTIATNGPLYIVGNYNADGSLPADPEDIVEPEAGEVPAAVAADAVTVLSTKWADDLDDYDADSDNGLSYLQAGQTEIATAIMTGLVPSNRQNNHIWSGAINNIVRYLEDWNYGSGQKKFGLRGNVTVLYESEVADEPWTNAAYDPPNRLFGLSQKFTDGSYPPGAPRARTFRRLGFRLLTEAEYQAALANIDSW